MNIVDKRGAWNQQNMTSNRAAQGGSIQSITIHGMATTNSTVVPAIWNTRAASAHYGVKDNVVEEYVAPTDVAWANGLWSGSPNANINTIAVEHLNNGGSGAGMTFSDATLATSVEFVAGLLKQYGLTVANLVRHCDVVPTACPQSLAADAAWNDYKNRVAAAMGSATVPAEPSTPAPIAVAAPGAPDSIVRVAQSATFKANETLNIRRANGSSLYVAIAGGFSAGATQAYDSYADVNIGGTDGVVRFVSWIGASGNRNYVARRSLTTGTIYGECY